jgi:hypothetical protein
VGATSGPDYKFEKKSTKRRKSRRLDVRRRDRPTTVPWDRTLQPYFSTNVGDDVGDVFHTEARQPRGSMMTEEKHGEQSFLHHRTPPCRCFPRSRTADTCCADCSEQQLWAGGGNETITGIAVVGIVGGGRSRDNSSNRSRPRLPPH